MEIKVVFLGESCTGKTQLIKVCCGYEFDKNSPSTLGCSYIEKYIRINNINYLLLLWDIFGSVSIRPFNKLFIKNSYFFILVYDITSKESFDNIYYWYNEIQDLGIDAIIGVVGTYLDLFEERKVDTEIGKKFADSIGAKFIEVSAKLDIEPFNIMLIELTKNYIKKYGNKDNRNQHRKFEFTKNTLLKYYKY